MIQLVKTLLPYLRPYWKRVLGSVLFSFALAGIKGYQAYLVKPIFDKGLSQDASPEQAMVLAGILLGLGVINFPCRFYHFYWIRYVVDKGTCTIRTQIFQKLQRLPLSFYTHNKQGSLLSNMLNDTAIFAQGFRNCVDLIREPLTAFIMLGLALYRDVQLTLVVLAVTPLFILIFNKSGRSIRNNQSKVQEEVSEVTHNINEGIAGQKITKAFNLQTYVGQRFTNAQDRYFNAQMSTTKIEEVAHPLVELVGAIAFSGVVLFAHHRISSGAMSTGDFVSFITALALLMDPIRKYSQANVKLNQARAAGERIFHLLALPEEKDNGTKDIHGFGNEITVNNLTFSYGEGDVIKDFSLNLQKGEKIALVGLSGSGKSTLINLLLGLYPVEKGTITIDGVSISNISLCSLRSIFGLVSQDVFLFHDTIRENLTLGQDFTEQEIAAALDVSYSADFVKALPEGLDTIIGDRGARLSGGQRQRITIARAFLQRPEVLLFDEATSALDNESEQLVQKALEQLAGDKTVIAVAHRLSTIQNFDRIYVLHEGHLIESGNHDQLIASSGQYARLYELSQR